MTDHVVEISQAALQKILGELSALRSNLTATQETSTAQAMKIRQLEDQSRIGISAALHEQLVDKAQNVSAEAWRADNAERDLAEVQRDFMAISKQYLDLSDSIAPMVALVEAALSLQKMNGSPESMVLFTSACVAYREHAASLHTATADASAAQGEAPPVSNAPIPDVVPGQIMTASGALVAPLHLNPVDILIEDCARSLSNICRYAGQINFFYSVAQHSVIVASLMPEKFQLEALLHDASEAYLGDLPAPLKHLPAYAFYRNAEHVAEAAVRVAFRLSEDPEVWRRISLIDKQLRVNERIALGAPRVAGGEPIADLSISFLNPRQAFSAFVSCAVPLLSKRGLSVPKGWRW